MAVIEMRRKRNGKDVLIGQKVMIGGKELKMKFTMPIWLKMEDEICLLDDLYTMMHSKGRFGPGKIPKLCEIMSEGVITEEDVIAETDPATIRTLIDEIQRVIAQAMTMKEKKYDDDSVHDETLEEIEKKETKAD